jgi:hypothetical protein
VHGRQRRHLERAEDAEHVQLPLLREVRGVGEEGEGDLHGKQV